MATSTFTPSRRSVMAGLAFAPLLGSAVSVKSSTPVIVWHAALKRYEKADEAYRLAEERLQTVYDLLLEREPSKPDMVRLRPVFSYRSDQSILKEIDVNAVFRWHVKHSAQRFSSRLDIQLAEVRSACDEVLRYRAKCDDLEKQLDWKGASSRSDSAAAELFEAEQALMDLPAPHGEALCWKLKRLFGESQTDDDSMTPWPRSFVRQFYYDVRQMSSLLDEGAQA